MFYKQECTLLMYVDDLILLHKSDQVIDNEIKLMKNIFKMEDMGEVKDYLGVNVQQYDNKIELTQPQMIEQIIKDVGLPPHAKSVHMPAMTTKHLNRCLHEPPHDKKFVRLPIGSWQTQLPREDI